MTHDPDHDLRAMNPDLTTTNGLSDRRLDEAYRAAQRGPLDPRESLNPPEPRRAQPPRDDAPDQVPWELRGTGGGGSAAAGRSQSGTGRSRSATGRPPRQRTPGGPSTMTRVVIALLLVIALVVGLVGRW